MRAFRFTLMVILLLSLAACREEPSPAPTQAISVTSDGAPTRIATSSDPPRPSVSSTIRRMREVAGLTSSLFPPATDMRTKQTWWAPVAGSRASRMPDVRYGVASSRL